MKWAADHIESKPSLIPVEELAMAAGQLPRFEQDLFSEDGILHPYEYYRQIRDLGPVVDYPMYDCFAVGRYDDVRRVLRDDKTFISGEGIALSAAMNEKMKGAIITSDSPRHEFLRKIQGEPLAPFAVSQLTGLVVEEAEQLLARIMAGSRNVDAMTAIAEYLPVTIVSELVGLPTEGRENMRAWAAAGFQLAGPFNARAQASLGSVSEINHYAYEVLDPSTVKPGSWAARAFEHAAEGTITPEMARRIVLDLVNPSLDTTILATGSLIMLLGQNPDQWQALKASPALIPGAVNEALRLETPIRAFTRHVAHDADIGGVGVPKGARLLVMYGSANRDERRWEHAERFDVTRSNASGQLAFGFGRHTCLGAHLAKLEMQSILKAMVTRVESFTIGDPVFLLNNLLRGPQRLPMTLH
jgi:cytochrome P450